MRLSSNAAVTALAAAAALSLPDLAQAQVRGLDIQRFDGRWFEIARSPNDLQRDCTRVQIDLTPTGRADRYDTTVACTRRADGRLETLRASARIDMNEPAKLRFTLRGALSFGGLAGQNYWVLAHAPDYSWAVLALPNKSDWWIWHRNANPGATVRGQALARARQLGLDTSRVVSTGN